MATRIVFTDGHSVSDIHLANSYTTLGDLAAVDLQLIRSASWSADNEEEFRHKKFRYQAEFLAVDSVPLSAIEVVGCLSRDGTCAAEALVPRELDVQHARRLAQWASPGAA